MTVDENCSTCGDKGLIECPCCSGQGGCTRNFYQMSFTKGYICLYCIGMGKIQCPQCVEPKFVIREKARDLFSRLLKKLLPEKKLL